MSLMDSSQLFLLGLAVIILAFFLRNHWLGRHKAWTPRPAPIERMLAKTPKTFRVRGVPLDWDSGRLQIFLQEGESIPTVKSLAREIHSRSSSGTVIYRDLPAALSPNLTKPRTLCLPKPPEMHTTRPKSLTLDADFLGMTTLFAPPEDDHKVDVIAISGLGGHAFGSFKDRGGEHMWLRDALPYDLRSEDTDRPMARLMTFGYDSAVAESQSMQNLEDLATAFHNSILPLASSSQIKPILFIAHSLGGLIVKQMLISLARSENEDDQKIVQAVYGIVFFGVPHDGMDISSLLPMVGEGPNMFLVQSISQINSQILSIQQRDFHAVLGAEGKSEIVCFYETLQSPTAKKDENGNWAMTGPPAVLVTKPSATHCRPWEDGPEHMCAVARSHSEMVKFGPNDPEYDKACERLRGLARRAVEGKRRQRAAKTKYLVPYKKKRELVGRSQILAELKQRLGFGQRRRSEVRSTVSLYGLGGVGKTQIALAFVYWLQETCPETSIFWVHASNADRFRQSFAQIAAECRIPGHDDTKLDELTLVKQWLARKENGNWLMVIDNADDAQLFFGRQLRYHTSKASFNDEKLAQHIPECSHGAVLVTTRNKQAAVKLGKSARVMEIPRMDEWESIELLRVWLKEDDRDGHPNTPSELSALSSRLEHLPLALVQAAAFIEINGISVPKYLSLLSESDQSVVDLLSEDSIERDSEALQAVAQTWMVSFRQIQDQDPLASSLLSLMSIFDWQGIPISFLSHYSAQERNGGPKSTVDFTKSLGVLKAFSLVSEQKGDSLDMHRLVQLVTRKWLINNDMMNQFGREALLTVSDIYPYGEFENRTACSMYLPHASAVLKAEIGKSDNVIRAKASLLHKVASYLAFEGKWNDAEKLNAKAVTTRMRVLGEEHPGPVGGGREAGCAGDGDSQGEARDRSFRHAD
ncbi:hypothetical protein HIM_10496 [Hirsutella minnesotensis 3608]|uniref:DUF7779 domain-containing protein n=1 Tax=Hirsutella minnesotensis 3608 TaxID=1043627 RepID=A0A0F7ZG20_9HYPO|nr:hypothetical protein HIM_10496 [Hirsutella minnesotensis 3608]